MKRRPTRALAMLLDHTLMLQHAALKYLDSGILSLSALPMLHMPQVEEVPGTPGTTGHAERCYCRCAREPMRGRGRFRGAGVHARGGAAPSRDCVVREHRGVRARYVGACIGCACPLSTTDTSTCLSRPRTWCAPHTDTCVCMYCADRRG
ncbi:hypothetical protein EDB89DRAFT_1983354 [Lactarius sanguifluus]|nr:hypothetical protein EDB89DRAFT_1983354 [Lactarius sanguifluus]